MAGWLIVNTALCIEKIHRSTLAVYFMHMLAGIFGSIPELRPFMEAEGRERARVEGGWRDMSSGEDVVGRRGDEDACLLGVPCVGSVNRERESGGEGA